MILIILCHVAAYYTFIPGHAFLGQIFNVGVEIFLIVSGYLYGLKNIEDFKCFYRKRYFKVAMPVQIWAVIMFCAAGFPSIVSLAAYLLNLQGIGSVLYRLDIYHNELGMRQTWFVTIILLCYLLLPALQGLRKKLSGPQTIGLLAILWGITIFLLFFRIHIYYFTLFASGYFASYYCIKNRISLWRFLGLSVITLGMAAGRMVLQRINSESVFYNDVYVHICMSALGFWFVLFIMMLYQCLQAGMDRVAGTHFFQWLEKMSYFIYLVHWCLLEDERNIYLKYSLGKASIIFIVFTVSAAIGLHWISAHLEKCLDQCQRGK